MAPTKESPLGLLSNPEVQDPRWAKTSHNEWAFTDPDQGYEIRVKRYISNRGVTRDLVEFQWDGQNTEYIYFSNRVTGFDVAAELIQKTENLLPKSCDFLEVEEDQIVSTSKLEDE